MPKRQRKPRPLDPELHPRGIADLLLMRSIVDFLDGWENCGRACLRRKGCASPTVACFDQNREVIREAFATIADWRRLDGPRDADELDQPVEDLFD